MIDLNYLSFSYPKKKPLFTDLKINLTGGNIYGLLGKNGAGKTTLLKIVSGLLFPDGGKCNILGVKPTKRFPDFLENIFFVPEDFYVPTMTINEYMFFFSPLYGNFDTNDFNKYIKEFGLSRKDNLSSLSYGQKKKFLIAFGLAANCNLLILDEPTNGLDIPSKSQFRKLIASTVSENKTIIISTHQVRDMQNIIDPIIILDEGQIVFNQHLHDVSKYLSAEIFREIPENESILYYEKTPMGYTVLSENKTGEETQIDLELLFNAVVTNQKKITSLFEREAV